MCVNYGIPVTEIIILMLCILRSQNLAIIIAVHSDYIGRFKSCGSDNLLIYNVQQHRRRDKVCI